MKHYLFLAVDLASVTLFPGRFVSAFTPLLICLNKELNESLLLILTSSSIFAWFINTFESFPGFWEPSCFNCHWRSWNECRPWNVSKWFLSKTSPRSITEKSCSRISTIFFSIIKINTKFFKITHIGKIRIKWIW